MRALIGTVGTLLFAAGFAAGGQWQAPVGAQGSTVSMDCGVASASQLRTTLYFGRTRPKGSVSELEWQMFLRDEVTQRFPEGLTVWEAEGQWRTATGSIDLPGEGVRPMGLAVSADGRELYASGGRGRTVHVIDLTATPPALKKTIDDVGERPWGIGIATKAKKIYTANGGSGDVSVIDATTGTVLRRIAVGGSPWGIAVR